MAVVVLFPAGSLVAYECALSLKNDKSISKLIGISSNSKGDDVTDDQAFDHVIYNAPKMSEELKGFILGLDHEVTHFIPVTDDAVFWAAKWNEEEGRKPRIMAPSVFVCNIVFDKLATYRMFPDISPRLYPNADVKDWYVKPRSGHSAIGCHSVKDDPVDIIHDPELVVCEELHGPEYTVECYGSQLLGVRERHITRGGMSVLSNRVVETRTWIRKIFNRIVETLSLHFPWFFQVKGGKLLEIQPRIPGAGSSYRLFWHTNPLVRWIVEGAKTHKPQPIAVSILKTLVDQVELDPSFAPKGIAVDWDDTLSLSSGKVNHRLVGALYSVYHLVPIVLVTKHDGDLLHSLNQHGIGTCIFSAVHHLGKTDDKSIDSLKDYLLIDDSFTERQQWKWWSIDPVSAVPILEALAHKFQRNKVIHCKLVELNIVSTDHVVGTPTAKDILQLERIRRHVELARTRAIETCCEFKKLEKIRVLDVGPERQPVETKESNIVIETLDISNKFDPDIVGDICSYVPCHTQYDLVLCTEVLEHTVKPWQAPETLWKLVRHGGYLLVTMPFHFRLHNPQPDGFRMSPVGLKSIFQEWFSKVEFMSVLETPGEPLCPAHTAILFKKPCEPTLTSQKINWAMDKGVSNLPKSAKSKIFTNGGPYVQVLEQEWLAWMGLSDQAYAAITCCNGTIGLSALATAYGKRQWYVQSNSFWADIQNSLKDAIVLPMRTDGRCGPLVTEKLSGLVVTTCFGQMTMNHQQEYLKAADICLFDHAAVVEPSQYIVGHGCMFSLHETKPLGRGEGGILVVPKEIEMVVRGILAYAEPRRQSTNGKMCDLVAYNILSWWQVWDTYVYDAYMELVKHLKCMVAKSECVTWMYPEETEIIPATLALVLKHPYDLASLSAKTRIPLRKYYEPLELISNEFYERSLVAPINPNISLQEYENLFEEIKLI